MTLAYRADKNRGRNTNDGLTAPWADPQMFATIKAPPAGTQLLLADDSEWSFPLDAKRLIPQVGAGGTQDNPIVIGKYSPSSQALPDQLPRIRWGQFIRRADWVYEAASNAWVYTDPTYRIGTYSLVLIGDTWEASTLGTEQKMPLAAVDGRYWCSNDDSKRLLMYSPGGGKPGTDPTSFYGSVWLSIASTAGFITQTDGRGFVRVEDIEFVDTGTGVLGYSAAAADVGLHALRIRGRRVAAMVSCVAQKDGQLHGLTEHCDVEGYGSQALWAYSPDGRGMRSMVMRFNGLRDGNHLFAQGAIYYQARSPGMVGQLYGNRISGARHGSRDWLMDGCAIYIEIGADDVDVFDNIIADCHLAFADNSGRRARITNNLLMRCKSAAFVSDAMNIGTTDHLFEGNTGILGADVPPAFGPGEAYAGWVSRHSQWHGKTIKRLAARKNDFINIGAAQLAAIRTPAITPAEEDYTDNTVRGYANAVALRDAPHTASNPPGTINVSERRGYVAKALA